MPMLVEKNPDYEIHRTNLHFPSAILKEKSQRLRRSHSTMQGSTWSEHILVTGDNQKKSALWGNMQSLELPFSFKNREQNNNHINAVNDDDDDDDDNDDGWWWMMMDESCWQMMAFSAQS